MRSAPGRLRGVTLIELVVVLTVVSIVAAVGATLVTGFVAGRLDNRGRLTLAAAADTALARVSDEIRQALPNSLRLNTAGTEMWIEWVPITDGGRWRGAPDTASGTPGDILDLSDPTDSGFDVIGTPLGTPAAGAQLVVENLGTPEADAYAGTSRRSGLSVSNGGQHVGFTPAGALPQSTATQRFFVVATPISLACRATGPGTFALWRYSGYGWLSTQPASSADVAAGTGALLLDGLTSCSAAYDNALGNIGLLNLQLGLADPNSAARMSFLYQLPVDNTP